MTYRKGKRYVRGAIERGQDAEGERGKGQARRLVQHETGEEGVASTRCVLSPRTSAGGVGIVGIM